MRRKLELVFVNCSRLLKLSDLASNCISNALGKRQDKMPVGTSPEDILDDVCSCNTNAVSEFFGACQVVTSEVVPQLCYDAVLPKTVTDPQRTVIQQAQRVGVCPIQSFPVVDGQTVSYNANDPPFRVALDEKAWQVTPGALGPSGEFIVGGLPFGFLDLNCNGLLNGSFPGCSKTAGGGACNWKTVISGQTESNRGEDNCGGAFAVTYGPSFNQKTRYCLLAASFCARTAFDFTYKPACCRQTLETEFSLSRTIWVTDTFWKHPTIRLGTSAADEAFLLPVQSQSFNPYELYCDPTWCPTSPACDATFFDLCQYSTTTVGGNTIHACLAADGECRRWFSNSTLFPTPETALLVGSHNWLLLDRMMENYCLNSATANGDTTSCACIGNGKASINNPGETQYYVSCSTLAIATNCPNGVVPVVPVDGSPAPVPLPGAPRILTDPVCSNIDCLASKADGSRFLTSGALQRALACPEQVCLLANMNSTFNIGNIGTGTRLISNATQFCSNNSFSSNAPSFRLVSAPTIWFYTNVGESITNDNQVSILRIENVSNEASTNMNWSISWAGAPTGGLPSWIQFQGLTSGNDLFPGKAASVQWSLGPVNETPAYFDLSLTVFALGSAGTTFSSQDLLLNFAIVDIDKKQPTAPSGADDAPNGLLLDVREKYSPGAIATLALVILLVVVAFVLLFQAWRTSSLIRKAQFWNAWN